jgi:uncharacterized repeat protein (TIGR02543 family)
MKNKLFVLVIFAAALIMTLSSCKPTPLPLPDPSEPEFVWDGFECQILREGYVRYVQIIGVTSNVKIGERNSLIFPMEMNGRKVISIGRSEAVYEKDYSVFFNYDFSGVDKIYSPILEVMIGQKLKGDDSPLNIILLEGKRLPDNLEGHSLFVPFDRYDKYRSVPSDYNLYKANISFKYNLEEGAEEVNYGYHWIDNLEEGEKLYVFPGNPERTGYDFEGWYNEPECVNAADLKAFVKYNVAEETVFYAKWTKKQ